MLWGMEVLKVWHFLTKTCIIDIPQRIMRRQEGFGRPPVQI